ncbi:MAG: PDZ domain-containing protein [Candidatus Rokuibacteriota bacterium]
MPLVRIAILVALILVTQTVSVVAAERWGWFGVRIRELRESEMEELAIKLGLSEGYGVVIEEILKDAPAAGSALRARDLIVAIEGRPIVETRMLQRIVGSTPPGRELRVVVLRDGRRRELRVPVGQMPPDAVAERIAAEFGFLVRDTTGGTGAADAHPGSPVIAAIAERSSADRAGLRVDDRILAVNGAEVGSLDAFRQRVAAVLLRDALRLRVQRKGEPLSLILPPAQPALPPQ